MTLTVSDGPEKDSVVTFELSPQKNQFKIGRSKENDLNEQDDQHLSNYHARFFYQGQRVYLEDLSSTNG